MLNAQHAMLPNLVPHITTMKRTQTKFIHKFSLTEMMQHMKEYIKDFIFSKDEIIYISISIDGTAIKKAF